MADEEAESVKVVCISTELRKIYDNYADFCKSIGWNPPDFEAWQKNRTVVDSGWKLNYLG